MRFWLLSIATFAGWLGVFWTGPGIAGAEYFHTQMLKSKNPQVEAQNSVLSAVGRSTTGAAPKSASMTFEERFGKGRKEFGIQLGYGFTIDVPPNPDPRVDRTNIDFIYFFPNFKYNLTGLIGRSFYRGALYWVVDGGIAVSFKDPDRNGVVVDKAPTYVIGVTPLQLEYKFLNPARRWAPYVFGGAGFSLTDWHRGASEISTAFEFILQVGGGLEFFMNNGHSMYFNYRFWHLSNSNLNSPNIGLNSHVFSLGYSF